MWYFLKIVVYYFKENKLLSEVCNPCPFAGLPLFGVWRCLRPGAEFGAALLSALAEDRGDL